MAKRALGWFGLAVVCAIAGGCNKATTDEGAAGPVAQDQLPGSLAKVVCDSFGSCCSAAHFVFDSTNCNGNIASNVRDTFGLSASGAVQYDAQAAGDCLAQLKAHIHCGNVGSATDIPACLRVTVGTLAPGQPCQSDRECKTPGICTGFDMTTGQRVCETANGGGAAAVRGTSGAACNLSCTDATDCTAFVPPGADPNQLALVACYRVDGLACSGGTCQPLGALGADCSGFSSCKDGLFCDGHCTAPHPNGAFCTDDIQCQSQSCSPDTQTCLSTSVTAQECANGSP